MKKILLLIFLVVITSCQKNIECKEFRDCLPDNIHPGDTGCGGCYPEGDTEICYEYNPTLCESYQKNYSCIDGICLINKLNS